jgi:ArsR family transcriptional regulator
LKELEKIIKALADRNRLRIIKLLEKRKLCVCEIAFILGITQPSVSRHLKKLSNAAMIDSEQDCFWTNYYLRKDNLTSRALLTCLNKHLNKQSVIKHDLEKLKKVNRTRLCCKR